MIRVPATRSHPLPHPQACPGMLTRGLRAGFGSWFRPAPAAGRAGYAAGEGEFDA
jgi:hypothetical protein